MGSGRWTASGPGHRDALLQPRAPRDGIRAAGAGRGPGGGAARPPAPPADAGGSAPSGLAPGLFPPELRSEAAPPLHPRPGLAGRPAAAAGAMKMHFCIPASRPRPDALGARHTVRPGPAGRGAAVAWGAGAHLLAGPTWDGTSLCLQLYSVYLDGFLFCKVRYSQLHRWNEQVSGSEGGTSLFT